MRSLVSEINRNKQNIKYNAIIDVIKLKTSDAAQNLDPTQIG